MNLTKQQVFEGFYLGYYDSEVTDSMYSELGEAFTTKLYPIIDSCFSIENAKITLTEKVCKYITENSKPPVVVCHSSGVDSTFMLLMTLKCFPDVRVVTVDYGEDSSGELRLSEILSKRLVDKRSNVRIGYSSVESVLNKITKETYRDWFHSSSLIPTYYAILTASELGETIITGDGGDELFCGYDRYIFDYYMRFSKFPVGIISKCLNLKFKTERMNKIVRYYWDGYEGLINNWDWVEVLDFLNTDTVEETILDRRMKATSKADLHYLDYLMMLDIGTELFGLEKKKVDTAVRMANNPNVISPFLDWDIIKWCCSLPIEYKYKNFTRKWLLREIIKDEIKDYDKMVGKKKRGFSVPIGEWWRTDRKLLWDTFSKLSASGFDKGMILKMMSEHFDGKRDHTQRLWSLVIWAILRERGIVNERKWILEQPSHLQNRVSRKFPVQGGRNGR